MEIKDLHPGDVIVVEREYKVLKVWADGDDPAGHQVQFIGAVPFYSNRMLQSARARLVSRMRRPVKIGDEITATTANGRCQPGARLLTVYGDRIVYWWDGAAYDADPEDVTHPDGAPIHIDVSSIPQ